MAQSLNELVPTADQVLAVVFVAVSLPMVSTEVDVRLVSVALPVINMFGIDALVTVVFPVTLRSCKDESEMRIFPVIFAASRTEHFVNSVSPVMWALVQERDSAVTFPVTESFWHFVLCAFTAPVLEMVSCTCVSLQESFPIPEKEWKTQLSAVVLPVEENPLVTVTPYSSPFPVFLTESSVLSLA